MSNTVSSKSQQAVLNAINKKRKAVSEGKANYATEQASGVKASSAGAYNLSDKGNQKLYQIAQQTAGDTSSNLRNAANQYEVKAENSNYSPFKNTVKVNSNGTVDAAALSALQSNQNASISDNTKKTKTFVSSKLGDSMVKDSRQPITNYWKQRAAQKHSLSETPSAYIEKAKNANKMAENVDEAINFAKKHPVLGAADSVTNSFLGSVTAPLYTAAKKFDNPNGEMDYNAPAFRGTRESRAERQGMKTAAKQGLQKRGINMIDDNGNATLANQAVDFGVDIGMSMADTAVRSALPVSAGSVQSGLLAAGSQAFLDAKDKGADDNTALLQGGAQGIAEMFFEKFSLEGLKAFKTAPTDSIKAIVKNITKQMVTEGEEESATEISNIITDAFIMGNDSDWSESYNSYLSQGYNNKQALANTIVDMAKRVGLAGLGGAISGGFLGGGAQALNYNFNRQTGTNQSAYTADELNEISDAIDADESHYTNGEAYEQAADTKTYLKNLANEVANGKQMSDVETGAATNAIRQTIVMAAADDEQNSTNEIETDELSNGKETLLSSEPTLNEGFEMPANDGLDVPSEYISEGNMAYLPSDNSEDYIANHAKRYAGDSIAQNIYLEGYNGQDAIDYDDALASAYRAGRNGVSLLEATQKNNVLDNFYGRNADIVEAMWTQGYESRTSIRESRGYASTGDEKNIAQYNNTTYNRYGWTKVNNILNKQNTAEFFNGIRDIKNGYNVEQASDGSYMIETASKSNGVKDTIVYTNGNYENPNISKVIKINADNETEAREFKEAIYGAEQNTLDNSVIEKLEAEGILRVYDRSSSPSYQELQRQGNGRIRKTSLSNDQGSQNRRGSGRNTEFSENKKSDVNKVLTWVGSKTGYKVSLNALLTSAAQVNLADRTIAINPSAENLLGELSHELVHIFRRESNHDYRTLRDTVIEALKEDESIDYDEMFDDYARRYRSTNSNLSDADIEEEIVADSCKHFLNDAEFVEKIAHKDKSLAERIADFFRDIADALSRLANSFHEGKASEILKSNVKAYRKAAATWYNALENVNKQTLEESLSDTEIKKLNDSGVSVVGSAVVRNSLQTWDETDKKHLAYELKKFGHFDESSVNQWIDDVSGIAEVIRADSDRLDYTDNGDGWLRPNADDIKVLDGSFLCTKKSVFQGTYLKILKDYDKAKLSLDDYVKLRNMLLEANYDVPCVYCYNESRTMLVGEFANAFLNDPKKYKKKYENTTLNGKPLTAKDLIDDESMRQIKLENPELAQDWSDWKKTYRGSQASLKVAGNSAYRRSDIMDIDDELRQHLNNNNGLRWFAFADFKPEQMIDCMQAVLDLSVKKIKSYAYTKQPNFVKLFGNTGILINMSVAGKLDENGELTFDKINGMDINEAKALREKFSKTAGLCLVGTSEEHIRKAMATPYIDYIIPFHRSGFSNASMDKLGIGAYQDMTKFQNERYLKTVTIESKIKGQKPKEFKAGTKVAQPILVNSYWDSNKTGDENAREYLNLCEQKGYIPKFDQFLTKTENEFGDVVYELKDEGYWKLLIDHKMYDNDGNGIVQDYVTPNFDMDVAKNILDTYDGKKDDLPVAQEVVDRFIKEYKKEAKSNQKEAENGQQKTTNIRNSLGELNYNSTIDSIRDTIKSYHEDTTEEELGYASKGVKEVIASTRNIRSRATEVQRSDNQSASDSGWGVNMGRHNSLRDGGGVKTVGLGITKEFVQRGYVDFRGRKLSSNADEAVQELATMSMVLRNPSFETFRIFYMKKNKIVGSEAFTSYLIDQSGITDKKNATYGDVVNDTKKRMKRLGADSYYLMHNHPSGRTKASKADLSSAQFYIKFIDGFKGEIILDHNEYGFIDKNGNATSENPILPIASNFNKRVVDHPLLYKNISSTSDVANMAKNVVHTDEYSTVIYADTQLQVRAVQEVHNNFLRSRDFYGYLSNRKLDFGSSSAFLVTKLKYDDIRALYENNLLTDVIYIKSDNTQSKYSYIDAGMKKKKGYNSQGYYSRNVGTYHVGENANEIGSNDIRDSLGGEDEYRKIRRLLSESTFHMPEGHEKDIERLGGLGALRHEFFMTLKITKSKGNTIDTVWNRLSDERPDLFSPDISNPADQLETIIDVLRDGREAQNYDESSAEYDTYLRQREQEAREQGMSEDEIAEYIDNIIEEDENNAKKAKEVINKRAKKNKPAEKELTASEKDKRLRKLAEKYGVMPKGTNPQRDVTVPLKTSDKLHVRRFARTALESGVISDEMAEDLKQEILDEAMSYEVSGDAAAKKHAEWEVDTNGVDYAQKSWDSVVNSLRVAKKEDIAVGELLLKRYAEAGDTANVLKMVSEIASEGTRAGQVVQAMSMLKKMSDTNTPEGKAVTILTIRKQVEKMNRDYSKKRNFKPIELDESLVDEYLNSTDEHGRENALDKIYQDLARQVPNTIADKLNQWRYLAMLGNPRTHIRNVVGNAIFVPAVGLKNLLGTVMEKTAQKAGKLNTRNKAVVIGKKYKRFAYDDFQEMQGILQGGHKGDVMSEIMDRREAFGNSKLAAPLNKIARWNSNMLEKEDLIFLKQHYIKALSSYLQSNNIDLGNINDDKSILSKARAYAVREAQKATYRDASDTAAKLNQLARSNNKALSVFVEAVLPFKKTPINILKRGVEYSPVGLIDGITRQSIKLRNGEITINDWIDSVASGMTGTMIVALGMFLSKLGIIMGAYSDDDKKKDLQKLMGKQEYSIELFGYSYTIDWAAPAVLPFLVGAEMSAALDSDEDYDFKDALESLQKIGEPMIQLSMLSGLNDTLDNISYANNKLTATMSSVVANYLSQFVPTLFGQVARTIDPVQRINYADKNSSLPSDAVYFLEKIQNKIPFLSMMNQAKVNQWGLENNKGNLFSSALQNMVSMGYVSKLINDDKVDNEIKRLYEEGVEDNITPDTAKRYFGQGSSRKDLTSEEYHTYQETMGSISYSILSNAVDEDWYQELSTDEQAEFFANIYDYAEVCARMEIEEDYVPTGTKAWVAKAILAEEDAGIAVTDYLRYKSGLTATKENSTKDNKQKNIIKYIKSLGLNEKQNKLLWNLAGYGDSTYDTKFLGKSKKK